MIKYVELTEYGGHRQPSWGERYLPAPEAGQIRVRTTTAGLNCIDLCQRRGNYRMPLPGGLGFESVGIVEAIGPGAL